MSNLQYQAASHPSRSVELNSVSTHALENPSVRVYAGIFTIASAVLLFELALTRIFSVVLWSNLAFMVVSTALFGFGLSGVFLALRPDRVGQGRAAVARNCAAVGITILASYLVITHVPFKMWEFHRDPLNYLALAVWEVSLLTPFFFAGLAVARLLNTYRSSASSLYGVDLIGAACGSFVLIPLLPLVGGVGCVLISAMLACVAALLFSTREQSTLRLFVALAFVGFSILLPLGERVLPLGFFQEKRRFNEAVSHRRLLATRWSPISRVDIARHDPRHGPLKHMRVRAVWIDAGTNASVMLKWSGKFEELKPINNFTVGAAYALKGKDAANALVIGSSGGREVLIGLSHGVQHIDAVEMDPSIVHFLNTEKFAKFTGNLFQNDRVHLVNDEGRAFLKRMPLEHYDVIQFVNNYTPVAMAAGALNLSETFLMTKEAFKDYYAHLTPNGVLALHRGATLRVALTAIEALRELGVSEPEKHILITNGEFDAFQGFFLKKSPWSKSEVQKITSFLTPITRVSQDLVLWSPIQRIDNIYGRVIGASADEQRDRYYKALGINLFPATDDRPFLERLVQFGDQKLADTLPREFLARNSEKWNDTIPRGDFPYVAILAESALLALLFIGVPLLLWSRGTAKTPGMLGFIGYFASLGFSFIVVEICLMKRYVLFLGHPAYSITTILVALLVGAGIGSSLTSRIGLQNPRRALAIVIPLLAVALVSETLLSPIIFEQFLKLEFAGRIAVASAMLLPLGILMGMPFPLGLRLIDRSQTDEAARRRLTAWAWGINGYTTVIGSAGTIFIALFFGFQAALLTATAGYLLGLAMIQLATR